MKRYGNLFERIYDIDNIRLAHENAKKGKGWYKEVKEIDANPDHYLNMIRDMLLNHTFRTSPYEVFYKQEGKKQRKIYKLPYFPDRIVQWAIMQVIEPILLNTFTTDTYSAIPEMGLHVALSKLQAAMQTDVQGCQYCFKMDIRHYYQSIDHDILKMKYRRLFKDPDLLELLDEIIDSIATADDEDLIRLEAAEDEEKGLPIGNYHSQYGGNYYLAAFDHWIKEVKHVKHYFRYMDDIIIFAETKEELHRLRVEIADYLKTNLKLTIKDNWQVFPTYERGIDYLGYRVFLNYTLLRKSTCLNMERKLKKIRAKCEAGNMMNYSEWCCINSYIGWLKHCNSYNLYQKYFDPLEPFIVDYYEKAILGGKAA